MCACHHTWLRTWQTITYFERSLTYQSDIVPFWMFWWCGIPSSHTSRHSDWQRRHHLLSWLNCSPKRIVSTANSMFRKGSSELCRVPARFLPAYIWLQRLKLKRVSGILVFFVFGVCKYTIHRLDQQEFVKVALSSEEICCICMETMAPGNHARELLCSHVSLGHSKSHAMKCGRIHVSECISQKCSFETKPRLIPNTSVPCPKPPLFAMVHRFHSECIASWWEKEIAVKVAREEPMKKEAVA